MEAKMWLGFTTMILLLIASESTLTYNFYDRTCPSFSKIVLDTVMSKQIDTPTTAAATIRLFLHDCLLTGCDASVLISSTPFNSAERDADINHSLVGDAFDVIIRAKTALELACPLTVSCADILAEATRDLVSMAGGPYYKVLLGRRDSHSSSSSYVEGHLPRSTMALSQITRIFKDQGFSVQEMVALSGAHTIGFSHCSEFYPYLKNDTGYNRRFASRLESACAKYLSEPALAVTNDIMTPNKFDNVYFQNLQKGLGLLLSDHALARDPSTKSFVDLYAADQNRFFADFAAAMVKLGQHRVKTGYDGEIRRRCDQVN